MKQGRNNFVPYFSYFIQKNISAESFAMSFIKKNFEKVLVVQKKGLPLHPQSGKQVPKAKNAEIAQLVEHNLAKVRVASSSLVFRSHVEQLFCGNSSVGRA